MNKVAIAERRAKGLCRWCDTPSGEYSMCEAHREAQRKRDQAYIASRKKSEKQRERRTRLKAAGLCIVCNKAQVVNSEYCTQHRRARIIQLKSWEERRRQKGLCTKCDAPRITEHYCERHRQMANSGSNRYYQTHREEITEKRASSISSIAARENRISKIVTRVKLEMGAAFNEEVEAFVKNNIEVFKDSIDHALYAALFNGPRIATEEDDDDKQEWRARGLGEDVLGVYNDGQEDGGEEEYGDASWLLSSGECD